MRMTSGVLVVSLFGLMFLSCLPAHAKRPSPEQEAYLQDIKDEHRSENGKIVLNESEASDVWDRALLFLQLQTDPRTVNEKAHKLTGSLRFYRGSQTVRLVYSVSRKKRGDLIEITPKCRRDSLFPEPRNSRIFWAYLKTGQLPYPELLDPPGAKLHGAPVPGLPSASPVAQADEPPFDWDEGSSPGTSLSVEIVTTMSQPPNGAVVISVNSSGFENSGSNLVLWQKTGGKYDKHNVGLGADGSVEIMPGTNSTMLGGYLRGQPFDIALAEEGSTKHARAKVVPFPIDAEGSGDCRATAEVQTESGLFWLVMLAGYQSGEAVKTTSKTKKETLTAEMNASEEGEITLPILYPPGSKGKAEVRAVGSEGCSVTITYAIGRSARKAR